MVRFPYPRNMWPIVRDFRGMLKDFGFSTFVKKDDGFTLFIKTDRVTWDCFVAFVSSDEETRREFVSYLP